jgi:hypothetical protein
MKNRTTLFSIVYLTLILGCKTELTKVVKKFDNGNIEEIYYIDKDSLQQGETTIYYKNGRVSIKTKYTNDDLKDTVYYYRDDEANQVRMIRYYYDDGVTYYKDFYENGNIKQKGIFDEQNKRIGIWKIYTKEGDLDFIKEYKIIKGESYTNQSWVFLPGGDTINEGTSMKYKAHPKRLKLGDSIRFFFQSSVASFQFEKKQPDFLVVIPKDYSKHNFTPDFSNIPDYNNRTLQTKRILSLKYNNDYPEEKAKIDTENHRKTVVFYIKPKKTGKDTIRGYFNEVTTRTDKYHNLQEFIDSNDTIYFHERAIYFDIPIEVHQ